MSIIKLSELNRLKSLSASSALPVINSSQNNDSNNIIDVIDSHGHHKSITLNEKQLQFVNIIKSGASCVLIGAAGTGKTTCTKAGIAALLSAINNPPIVDSTHKYIKAGNSPVIVTAYTRRATQNIKRQMSPDIGENTITCHKLIEYAPVFIEVYDEEKGKFINKRVFEPKRNSINKLCKNIRTIIIDESSMLSVALFEQIQAACHNPIQWVFIGDLNQLPPVFGHAILGYKLLDLPVIELTEVYRQALDSPIISLAHRILSGTPILDIEFKKYSIDNGDNGKVSILPYHKRLDSESAMIETMKMFYEAYNSGFYNPDSDIILCPQNKDTNELKRFNCTRINSYIANHIARQKKLITYEIICGFRKLYFSVGDRCLFDKMDCTIVEIRANDLYIGVEPQPESEYLDYFGHNPRSEERMNNESLHGMDIDAIINLAGSIEDDSIVRQSSHIITVKIDDDDSIFELRTTGDINKLDLSYAITVHKSQGSEWDKVFLLLHSSHNAMIKRELLYTACTRAKNHLLIVCEKDSLIKGIRQQAIKGNTLEEKAEFFKGKIPVIE